MFEKFFKFPTSVTRLLFRARDRVRICIAIRLLSRIGYWRKNEEKKRKITKKFLFLYARTTTCAEVHFSTSSAPIFPQRIRRDTRFSSRCKSFSFLIGDANTLANLRERSIMEVFEFCWSASPVTSRTSKFPRGFRVRAGPWSRVGIFARQDLTLPVTGQTAIICFSRSDVPLRKSTGAFRVRRWKNVRFASRHV